eukprot:scaffold264368_cov32-Tisochrysis_lutea.AAC.1
MQRLTRRHILISRISPRPTSEVRDWAAPTPLPTGMSRYKPHLCSAVMHAAEIDELLSQLREEVTTIEETNWVYEGGETHVVKIRT